ncbi:MAG: hypothetical protein ACLP0J_10010 [Solirubrobacteraceae bacterium]
MNNSETVAVKQRIKLGPEWPKAAGLDVAELSIITHQIDHEPTDRHL